MLSWTLFKRYLLSKQSESLVKVVSRLCVLGVAVGVASFIIVLSIMNGFSNSTMRRHLIVEPHIVIKEVGQNKKAQFITPLVQRLDKYELQDVFLRSPDNFSGAIAKGVSRELLKTIFLKFKPQKAPPSEDEYLSLIAPSDIVQIIEGLKPGEVIIGVDLARSMGLVEGDKVTVLPPETLLLPAGEAPLIEKIVIKGLFSTNIAEVDGNYIYYLYDETLTSFKKTASREEGYEVRLTQAELYNEYLQSLTGLSEYSFETWVDRNSSLFLALKVEKWTMTTFLSLAALITSFTIITVLILLITQKRNDIGVLMTLGLSSNALQKIYTRMGLYLFGIGLIGGMIFGVLVSLTLQMYPLEVLPNIYYERTIPSQLDIHLILWMCVGAIIIGSLASWIPARRIVKMSPIDILR